MSSRAEGVQNPVSDEVLKAYVAKTLPERERIRLHRHLLECMPCALRVADLRWTTERPREAVSLPEILDSRGCATRLIVWTVGEPRRVLPLIG